MASETAATVLGLGEAGLHKQSRTRETDRRESWIPYPVLPDADEPAGIMDYAEFTRLCQEDIDALFNIVNEAYASLEAALPTANRRITTLGSQNSDLEDENRRLKDQVSQQGEQADELIDEAEGILASRLFRKRTLQYKAKWVGYDTDPGWYNAENFKGSHHMLRDFHRDNPSAAGLPSYLIGSNAGSRARIPRIEVMIIRPHRPEDRPINRKGGKCNLTSASL